jgi:glycosyltransferase involved in cell wall biosynthesis
MLPTDLAAESWPKVSVVIPAMNEARNLPHVFKNMPSSIYEVILVDGNSTDDTVAVAQREWPDIRVVTQTRRGKGNALACGFAAATGDIIAAVDADGSADPGEIPAFVEALLQGYDFAKGSRSIKGGGSADLTRLRKFGNLALSAVFNVCYRTHYTDLCYGWNVFWRRHLPVLDLDTTTVAPDGGRLWGDGFEIETLIHVRVAKSWLTVTEVPSFEHNRIHGESNLSTFGDGFRVLRTIFSEAWRTRVAEPVLHHEHHTEEPATQTVALEEAGAHSLHPEAQSHEPVVPPTEAAEVPQPRDERTLTGTGPIPMAK